LWRLNFSPPVARWMSCSMVNRGMIETTASLRETAAADNCRLQRGN
jgi:hypothetical protein